MIIIGHKTYRVLHGRIKRIASKVDGHNNLSYDDYTYERMLKDDRRNHNAVNLVRPFEEIEALTLRPKPKRLCKRFSHALIEHGSHIRCCNDCADRYFRRYLISRAA